MRHSALIAVILALLALAVGVLMFAPMRSNAPTISILGATNSSAGLPAIALCFKNNTRRGLTVFYIVETLASGDWWESSGDDEDARILWYVHPGVSQVLTVRPPPDQSQTEWRISCWYTVGNQNRFERIGNWVANKVGFGPLLTPYRTISSTVFKRTEQPNMFAPHEPPLPVSGSGAPVHRTLDSLPTPDSGDGR